MRSVGVMREKLEETVSVNCVKEKEAWKNEFGDILGEEDESVRSGGSFTGILLEVRWGNLCVSRRLICCCLLKDHECVCHVTSRFSVFSYRCAFPHQGRTCALIPPRSLHTSALRHPFYSLSNLSRAAAL
jgi:hypothetical protein